MLSQLYIASAMLKRFEDEGRPATEQPLLAWAFHDAAHKIDSGDEARVEVSAIKFYAAKVLNDVIDRAVQVHGARGLTDETPLAGMLMQARGGRIYDGPDEVHREVVARRILKAFANGEGWQFS